MPNPSKQSNPQQLAKLMALAAVGMFIAFIAFWIVDFDRTVTIALGVVAVLDAAWCLFFYLRSRSAAADPDSTLQP